MIVRCSVLYTTAVWNILLCPWLPKLLCTQLPRYCVSPSVLFSFVFHITPERVLFQEPLLTFSHLALPHYTTLDLLEKIPGTTPLYHPILIRQFRIFDLSPFHSEKEYFSFVVFMLHLCDPAFVECRNM